MTKLEKFKRLSVELEAAYQTVLNNPGYDQATVEYAKRCAEDASRSYRNLFAEQMMSENPELFDMLTSKASETESVDKT